MAKISARGDRAAIKLRKPDGGLVALTERGRLLEQRSKGAGYVLVDPHRVTSGAPIIDRQSVLERLLDHYPGAEVVQ